LKLKLFASPVIAAGLLLIQLKIPAISDRGIMLYRKKEYKIDTLTYTMLVHAKRYIVK